MRKVAAFGFVALSIFLILSFVDLGPSPDESSPGETSQDIVSITDVDSDQEGNTKADDESGAIIPSTSDEIALNTPDPALVANLTEIELDRAELVSRSETDTALLQEFARNRAMGSFRIASDLGDQFLYEEGIPYVNEAIEMDPSLPEAHLLSGYLNFKLNYNEDAITAFEKTIELDPMNFDAHFFLGVIYYGIDELPKSIDYLTQSTKLATTPDQISDAFANRGLTYCLLELYDECIADVEKALYLDPNNGFSILIHGTVFKEKALREMEATGKEGIPGVDLGVNP